MQQEPDYKDTGYTVPTEGTIYWVDTWVLLDQAPHPNAAYAFLNWIQEPDIQVTESLYAGYASCNDDAKALLPPEFVNNPAVYVPEEQLAEPVRVAPTRAATSSAPTSGPSSSPPPTAAVGAC